MGKKTKSSPATHSKWKSVELDFLGEKKLNNDDAIFEEISVEQFNEKIINPVLKSEQSFSQVLDTLSQWKNYLEPRSDRLYKAFHSTIKTEFEHISITLNRPFDESKWQELETMGENDLNKTPIRINGIPTTAISLVSSFETLLKTFEVNVKCAEIFPFDIDSYGLPPINCRKIWNPLLWMRSEIENKIKGNCRHDQVTINQLITSLSLAPKEGHFEKLAITSFFLENTADNLDYSKKDDKKKFMEELKMMFGTTKVNKLTMVLPDILMAYSEELVERVMQVSYFIPFELFRLIFLCWQPKILKLRLRSEACDSIEDAARIEWDDEEVFTSTTLFNCPLFDRCEPVCLGDEDEIKKCKLIVETTGSRLFDPVHNKNNCDTAGRDFLTLFPMQTILMKKTVTIKSGTSVKTQLKQHAEFIVDTFFFNAEDHQERVVNYELIFENVGEVQMSVVRKCIPQTTNKRKIGVDFNVEQETKDLFTEFGTPCSGRHMFVSFFDAENQVIVDLKIVLSN